MVEAVTKQARKQDEYVRRTVFVHKSIDDKLREVAAERGVDSTQVLEDIIGAWARGN